MNPSTDSVQHCQTIADFTSSSALFDSNHFCAVHPQFPQSLTDNLARYTGSLGNGRDPSESQGFALGRHRQPPPSFVQHSHKRVVSSSNSSQSFHLSSIPQNIPDWNFYFLTEPKWDVSNTTTHGTARFKATDLIDQALNGRTPTAYDETEDGSRVVNQQEPSPRVRRNSS